MRLRDLDATAVDTALATMAASYRTAAVRMGHLALKRAIRPAAPMLPAFWRFIHAFWIGAPAVDATHSILHFGGAGVGVEVLKLLGWLALVALVLALPISRKLARQRQHDDVGPGERATA